MKNILIFSILLLSPFAFCQKKMNLLSSEVTIGKINSMTLEPIDKLKSSSVATLFEFDFTNETIKSTNISDNNAQEPIVLNYQEIINEGNIVKFYRREGNVTVLYSLNIEKSVLFIKVDDGEEISIFAYKIEK